MTDFLFSRLLKPALFSLSPELAHSLSIRALKTGLLPSCPQKSTPQLEISLAGLDFPNPLGIAAGYDKNAEVPSQLLKIGFGFTEIGTVTPRPQPGNPRPRIFRLENEGAIINRLGFNNEGHQVVLRRLQSNSVNGILGVNIGANKDSPEFIADYVAGIETFADPASYFAINISSPNTPGLRNLQAGEALKELLDRVLSARDSASIGRSTNVPVFLKIAPDLDHAELDEIAAVVNASGLDGMIISNTTLDRALVKRSPDSKEAGGLSGKPLFNKSTIVLARMRQRLAPGFPIIGVGGVDSAETAIAKIEAGANLVQIYTGLVYKGPGLPGRITSGLVDYLGKKGHLSISDIVGSKTDEWAQKEI